MSLNITATLELHACKEQQRRAAVKSRYPRSAMPWLCEPWLYAKEGSARDLRSCFKCKVVQGLGSGEEG
jgi:hypothetical protein